MKKNTKRWLALALAISMVISMSAFTRDGFLWATTEGRNTPDPTATPPVATETIVVDPNVTKAPTEEPTAESTAAPAEEPTAEPTAVPTAEPTVVPTTEPTQAPRTEPTTAPTTAPVETQDPAAGIDNQGESEIPVADSVSLQVNFVYKSGGRVSRSFNAQLEAGGEFNVPVPAIDGHEIEVEGGGTLNAEKTLLTGTVNGDTVITVTYSPVEMEYTVKHVFPRVDANGNTIEALVETEVLKGRYGEETKAVVKQKPHYDYKPYTDRQIVKDTVITINYELKQYKLSYNTNGGTYVAAQYGKYGQSLAIAAGTATEPVSIRQGYQFAGWYTDAELTTPATSPIAINGDTTLYAKWTPVEVAYTVTYWRQKVTDKVGMADAEKSYDFAESVSGNKAMAGTVIDPDNIDKKVYVQGPNNRGNYTEVAVDSDYRGFRYNANKSVEVTVEGDGTTVVNVYYDRVEVTANFSYTKTTYEERTETVTKRIDCPNGATKNNPICNECDGYYGFFSGYRGYHDITVDEVVTYPVSEKVTDSYTGLFGAPFVDENGNSLWPTTIDGVEYKWENSTTAVLLGFFDPDSCGYDYDIDANGNQTVVFTGKSSSAAGHIYYYNEQADGTYKLEQSVIMAGSSTNLTVHPKFEGYELYKGFGKWEEVSDDEKERMLTSAYWDSSNAGIEDNDEIDNKHIYIAHKLKTYTVTYWNVDSAVKTVPGVKYTLPLTNFNRVNPLAADPGAEYKLTKADKPESLADKPYLDFAGWYKDAACTVPFDFANETMPNANLVLYAKWEAPERDVLFETNDGTEIASQKIRAGNPAEVPADPTKDGYRFMGWYTDNTFATPFDFAQPIIENTTIYAKWEEITIVNYTVKYLNKADNSEVYPTETHKFDLTGKDGDAANINITAKPHDRLIPDKQSQTLTVTNVEANNVVTFYYSEPGNVYYKVNYISATTGRAIAPSEVKVTANNIVYEKPLVISNYESTFIHKTLVLANEATPGRIKENVITFTYNPVFVVSAKGNDFETVKYDGTEKSATGFLFSIDGPEKITDSDIALVLKAGSKAEVKGTDAGTYNMGLTWNDFEIAYGGNTYNAENTVIRYATVTDGTGTITKRDITLTAATAEKQYDGTPLTDSTVTVSGDGFVEGEGATYTVKGSQTDVGSSRNILESYTLTGKAKAENYNITPVNGTLTVKDRTEKYAVEVKANSKSATYNGNLHTVSGFETLSFVVNGNTYTVSGITAEASGTNVSESKPVVIQGTPVVKDAKGTDVTNQFNVNLTNGMLNITPVAIELTAGTASQQYNGQWLRDATFTVTNGEFVGTEGVESVTTSGGQLYVGSSENVITAHKLKENTKAENYTITYKPGTLTVINRDAQYKITVEANSGEFIYDGTPKTVSGLKQTTFTVDGNEYTVSGLTATATRTDAGTTAVNVTGSAVVKDNTGAVVTAQFAVSTTPGTLTVAKRDIEITAGSASAQFTGKALTNSEYEITAGGFANGRVLNP